MKALTGEVHTIPLKQGDAYILTNLGEGIFKVWRAGKVTEEEVSSQNETPQFVWWAQIRLPNGTVGWTKETDQFENQDSCG